jgi:PAS domain S-box-containing protein
MPLPAAAPDVDDVSYRSWYENSPSIFLTTDARGTIIAVNRFGAEYLGIDRAELVGRQASSLVYAEDRPAFLDQFERCRRAVGTVQRQEFRKVRGDGSVVWVREAARALERGNGDLVILSACEDITDRVRADETAQFLVEAGKVLATSLDYETTLRTVADLAVPRLADWCAIDLLDGDAIRRVAVAHADPSKAELAREYQRRYPPDSQGEHGVAHVLRTGEAQLLSEIPDALIRAFARDDEQYTLLRELGFCSAVIVPLPLRDRNIGAITLIAAESGRRYGRDELRTTELLAQRAALSVDKARLYRESRAAVQARDEVLSIVSHDLRNPVNTIMLSAGHMLELGDALDMGVARRHLVIVKRQAEQMNRMIQDLLDVARIEAGRLPLSEHREDPARLVREACESLAELASQNGIRLESDAPAELPAVCADRDRVLQVFGNLIGNALRFTEPGGIVRVSAAEGDGVVEFAVSDSGAGIAAEDLPHLFERFYQARSAEPGGAGLGLAIVKGIVETHGGRVAAESTLGTGSTFRFTIPLANAPAG